MHAFFFKVRRAAQSSTDNEERTMLIPRSNIQVKLAAVLTTVGMAASAPAASPATPAPLPPSPPPSTRAPDFGLQWCVIGDPGNRPVNYAEGPNLYDFNPDVPPFRYVGTVHYEYRLSKTEITATQWFEFVQAYAPYWTPEQTHNYTEFTSGWVDRQGPGVNGQYTYSIVPGADDMPVDVGWRMAARYCNWLCNGKAAAEWAFQSGAYGTSTFTQNPDGTYNDQREHTPGAPFWIPTLDEWTKGMHWDPAKDNGQGGYWLYPTSSDVAPITGLPVSFGGDGTAQTSAGIRMPGDPNIPYIPVGQYPDVMSPWGLLDGSGGFAEWTEFAGEPNVRVIKGSDYLLPASADKVDYLGVGVFSAFRHGVRVASVVPTPATSLATAVVVIASCFFRRNRRGGTE